MGLHRGRIAEDRVCARRLDSADGLGGARYRGGGHLENRRWHGGAGAGDAAEHAAERERQYKHAEHAKRRGEYPSASLRRRLGQVAREWLRSGLYVELLGNASHKIKVGTNGPLARPVANRLTPARATRASPRASRAARGRWLRTFPPPGARPCLEARRGCPRRRPARPSLTGVGEALGEQCSRRAVFLECA